MNRFYEEGRDLYLQKMDAVIDQVVTIVGTGLTEAKNDVADGRKQVKEYVAKLPEDLKEVGVEAAENIHTQFDGLEQDIDSKQDELIDTLAQKYKENLDAVDARIKACKAIYDIVKFFMEHAQQIADLINSILDAIALVASGVIDKAAQAVEDSLAKAIPVAIGFLASVLGFGGISEKVQSIIQKMRQPIDKAIDWVIDQGVKAYKKVSNKLKKSKLGKKIGAAKKKAKQKLKAAKQWG